MVGQVNNGGLNGATQAALSSLQASSKKIANIANNIANVNNPNYTTKSIDVTSVTSNGGGGVSAGIAHRTVNEVFVEDYRLQGQKTAYCQTLNETYQVLDQNFGTPNDANSLRGCVQNFVSAASGLATSPTSTAQLQAFLQKAQGLTTELNTLSNFVQSLRLNCDQAIDNGIGEINKNLVDIRNDNAQIQKNNISKQPVGDYLDQRDKTLRNLSSYLDIKINPHQSFQDPTGQSGIIDITTSNGFGLLQSNTPMTLDFTPTTSFGATNTTKSQISINGQDITSQITSGSLAANIQLRDTILPNLQNDLDTLTAQLRDSVNKVHNEGAGYPSASSLTGQRTFATGATSAFSGSGVIRVALLDSATGNYLEAQDYDLASATTLNDVMSGLTTTSGTGHIKVQLNAANQLVVSSTLTNASVALGSVGPTATESVTSQSLGFSHYFGLNDFFVTGSQVIQDGSSITGLANQISLRSDLSTQPARISRGQLNTTLSGPIPPNSIPTQPGLYPGSDQIIRQLAQTLTQTTSLPTSGNLNARTVNLTDYAQDIMGVQARTIKANKDDMDTQIQQLNLAQKNVTDNASVSSSDEITHLLAEKRNYELSKMVVKIVNELFDTLLSIRQ